MISALKTMCSSYSSCLVNMLTCTPKYLLHFKQLKNWHETKSIRIQDVSFFLPVDVLDSVQMDTGSKSIRTESSTKKAKKKETRFSFSHFPVTAKNPAVQYYSTTRLNTILRRLLYFSLNCLKQIPFGVHLGRSNR